MAKEHLVYFVQRGDNAIKIGKSVDLAARMWFLERDFGKLKILGVVDGYTELERTLHQTFCAHLLEVQPTYISREKRLTESHEWFQSAPELMDYIRTHARPYTLQKRSALSITDPYARTALVMFQGELYRGGHGRMSMEETFVQFIKEYRPDLYEQAVSVIDGEEQAQQTTASTQESAA